MANLGFAASIRINGNAILEKVNKEVNRIAWELFTNVVRITPSPSYPGKYAKGLLANQWYPSAGTASNSKGSATSPNGSASLSRINALVPSSNEFLGKDGKLILANNLDYAYQAEVLGWTRTRGYRMVAISLMAVAAKNKAIKIRT